MTLTALILGSGFAGQGHARALRDARVELVGMVSRTPDVVSRMAGVLDIPYTGTDFSAALEVLKPDIVSVGMPGGAHFEPVMAALKAGCHIFCDKPLAATAAHAKIMFETAVAANVKTAYAASYRYQPCALLARELIAEGRIGHPLEVECVSHFNLDPLIPFGWSHRIEDGGGRLNNNFTHKLSIVEHVLNGHVSKAAGETRNDLDQAPVVSGVHDFRKRRNYAPTSADDPRITWASSNAEWSYTVLAHIQSESNSNRAVLAVFKHCALQPRFNDDYIAFYGSEGAIHIQGHYAQGPLFLWEKANWITIPIPSHITDALPKIADDTQRNWNQLAQEFVADICGDGDQGYQTFRDGWIYQEVIDFIRTNDDWLDCTKFYRNC
jgi:predicted dehydrogenase